MITLNEVIEMAKTAKESHYVESDVVVYKRCATTNNKTVLGFFFENGLQVGYNGSHPNGDKFEVLAII